MKSLSAPTIPFSPLPYPLMKRLSSPLAGLGASLAHSFPYLGIELGQADLKTDADEYTTIALFVSGFYFVLLTGISAVFVSKLAPKAILFLPPTAGAILALPVFVQITLYPRIRVKKKVREIERNLVFALRTIMVELRSGVDLFTAMNMVASRDFGVLSQEFRATLDEISTGELEEEALQRMAARNPSPYLRKVIWQLTGGMKGGADINDVMREIVTSLTKEQQIQIKKYGASLGILSLMYMMMGVIIPALGVTFMVILGTFPQISFSELMFWALLAGLAISQFMYLGMLKLKRPNLLGDE
ncbi:MAG: type II secretion system F family protein [Candidatus Diapherotrites archaeon]|nr:type II secretion system F family protein [Candidatus Diapherotrites archaeon]